MTTKPKKLGPAGTELWTSVTKQYDLDPLEAAVLGHACRQSDLVAALEVQLEADGLVARHVAELRQARLAVGKLLDGIKLPPPVDAVIGPRNQRERRDLKAATNRARTARQMAAADGIS